MAWRSCGKTCRYVGGGNSLRHCGFPCHGQSLIPGFPFAIDLVFMDPTHSYMHACVYMCTYACAAVCARVYTHTHAHTHAYEFGEKVIPSTQNVKKMMFNLLFFDPVRAPHRPWPALRLVDGPQRWSLSNNPRRSKAALARPTHLSPGCYRSAELQQISTNDLLHQG